ncbi:STAS domain-containing protein [Ramlibacter tataouinensis]|uniref:STAS domain-containing protein n=1 Tax=Ramlibacter tataouinensis TaxID=94132 RepID=UPI0022F398EC|nr:STAS domain-containing protein [Ramlibacter tataouinensis]WBY03514.1 STAS domain-containing protein [Ramlibacter tataouinensis]
MLVLPVELTHDQAPACSRMLAQALRAEPQQQAVADAAALQRFDSSALAVLLECRREALALGKGFSVAHMPPRLRELAGVYGVSELLAAPPAPAAASA